MNYSYYFSSNSISNSNISLIHQQQAKTMATAIDPVASAVPRYYTSSEVFDDDDDDDDGYDTCDNKYGKYDIVPSAQAKGGAKSTNKQAQKPIYSQVHVRNVLKRMAK